MYHYGRSPDEAGYAARRDMRQAVTALDASFIMSIFEYQLRMVPGHEYVLNIIECIIC